LISIETMELFDIRIRLDPEKDLIFNWIPTIAESVKIGILKGRGRYEG